ncbi:hypothetical protein KSF78_0008770 [Schistosoma japonicum]|nr:hypothetical protein KSF78_0008770 [Schistosoma japonicum]
MRYYRILYTVCSTHPCRIINCITHYTRSSSSGLHVNDCKSVIEPLK